MQGEPAAAPSTPAVSKSRPVFVSFPCLARPRLFPGVWPAHGSCTCGGQVARLRRASHAPCLFLPRVSHARAPAAGKSRSGFVSLPNRARTRFFPGACSRTAPVFPGGEKARACGGHTCGGQVARLRRASRAPCLFLPRVSHARGFFRVWAHAGLLFPQAGRNPTSCSLRPGGNPPGKSPGASPTHRNARKAELCSLAFRAFPLSAGGLRPEGPLSRPAARGRGRSAKGHRRPPSHRNA